jgi:hypothetical protein
MFAFAVAPIMVSSVNASRLTCPCIIRSLGLKTFLWNNSVANIVNSERNAFKLIVTMIPRTTKEGETQRYSEQSYNFQPSRIYPKLVETDESLRPLVCPRVIPGRGGNPEQNPNFTTRSGAKSKFTGSAHAFMHLRLNAGFCLTCDHHFSLVAVGRF